LRRTSFTDYETIAALHLRNGLPLRAREDWAALWTENPAYKNWDGPWPIGWLLENRSGEVVGSIGNLPLTYRFQDRRIPAAAPFSWVVDSEYRGFSIALPRCVLNQQAVELFVSTTVSSLAEPALKALRWIKAPVGEWNKSAFWISHYRNFARATLKLYAVPADRILQYPAAALLCCRDCETRARGADRH